MKDSNVKLFSKIHSLLFKVTGGRIGSRLVENDMLLLTTTGELTGKLHTVPLLYLIDKNSTDGRESLVIIASYGGRPDHPQWYRNLLANQVASVQIAREHQKVLATTMDTDEREVWWPRVVEAHSTYSLYASRTDREIPLVRLEQIG